MYVDIILVKADRIFKSGRVCVFTGTVVLQLESLIDRESGGGINTRADNNYGT